MSNKYGGQFWCVKVPASVQSNGRLFVWADRVIIEAGALCMMGYGLPNVILAAGNWIGVFLAHVEYGTAVAVQPEIAQERPC